MNGPTENEVMSTGLASESDVTVIGAAGEWIGNIHGPLYVLAEQYIPNENWRPDAYKIYKKSIDVHRFDVRVNTANESICGILAKFVYANGTPVVMDSRNSTLEILSQSGQAQMIPAIAKSYYTYVQQYTNGIQPNPDLWTYYFGETTADLTLRFSIEYSTAEPVWIYVYTFARQTFPVSGELVFGNYITERIHNESFMGIDTQTEPYLLWMVSK
jgi:hypothetical protein